MFSTVSWQMKGADIPEQASSREPSAAIHCSRAAATCSGVMPGICSKVTTTCRSPRASLFRGHPGASGSPGVGSATRRRAPKCGAQRRPGARAPVQPVEPACAAFPHSALNGGTLLGGRRAYDAPAGHAPLVPRLSLAPGSAHGTSPRKKRRPAARRRKDGRGGASSGCARSMRATKNSGSDLLSHTETVQYHRLWRA
jgi:hypothetical protein